MSPKIPTVKYVNFVLVFVKLKVVTQKKNKIIVKFKKKIDEFFVGTMMPNMANIFSKCQTFKYFKYFYDKIV